jgi:hypothetical protein
MRPLRHSLTLSLALVLALGCLAVAASAQQQDVAVGSSGELFTVRTGLYADLFPGAPASGGAPAAGESVLALDILRPGSPVQRLLVPNQDAPGTPTSPSVLVERASGVVFLVWKAVINYNNVLYLTSFDGANWSERIQILGNPWAQKAAPQLAVTHYTYQDVAADQSPLTRNRTIIHMVWAEQDSNQYEVFYRPIIIDDGSYLGWIGAIRLADLDPSPAVSSAAVSAALSTAPIVQPGRDQRTVVVTFASASSGRLIALEIDALPEELRHSANEARGVMIDIGRKLSAPARGDVAAQVRRSVIGAAAAFHSDVAQSLGDAVAAFIAGSGTADLTVLADQTRTFLIAMGADFAERGLRLSSVLGAANSSAAAPPAAPPTQPTKIIEVDPVADAAATAASSQIFQLRVASSRPAPAQPDAAGTGHRH